MKNKPKMNNITNNYNKKAIENLREEEEEEEKNMI